jgi:basic amino acid/polyamine antiporter, APA family
MLARILRNRRCGDDTTSAVSSTVGTPPAASLSRELGRWDMTAIGVNQTIGGAVFALPAALAASAGAWSPWMVAAVAGASMLIALSFAEVGSRFEVTGGSYLYTRAAFGRFAAFEVGWMMWFTRVASWASVINVLASALGFYWPVVTSGLPRGLLLTSAIALVAGINVIGVRQSSFVVNALTFGKLLPLTMFIAVGIFFVDWSRITAGASVSIPDLSTSALLLIFAFGGYESMPVMAGETRNPRRDVPFALIMTILIVGAVLTLAQVVALGTLPGLATSKTPLADAAVGFLGAGGAVLMTLGAVFSTSGNNMGSALAGSRNLFALAEQGDVPRLMARVHPRFRTPVNAILITAAVVLVLALSGTFQKLAAASSISRLVVYVATCTATLRLRGRRFEGVVKPALFVVPFGPVIPLAAIVISLAILAGATSLQLTAGVAALAAGAMLYLLGVRGGRTTPALGSDELS